MPASFHDNPAMTIFLIIALIFMFAAILAPVIAIGFHKPKYDLNKPISAMTPGEVMLAQQRANWELEEAKERLRDAQRVKANKERALARRRDAERDQMIREMYTKTTGKLPPKG